MFNVHSMMQVLRRAHIEIATNEAVVDIEITAFIELIITNNVEGNCDPPIVHIQRLKMEGAI